MGQRGPIPLEPGEKALRGNTSGRKITRGALAPGKLLPVPEWMTLDQREVWKEVVRNAPKHLLARVDAGVLTTYVVSLHAYNSIAKLCEGKPWDLARHADALAKHQTAIINASKLLGLDPASRARLRIDAESPATPAQAANNLFEQLKEA
jgi:phage terminase small subunit